MLAVAALCATAVFGGSLTHLMSSPALYGVPFQVSFANEGSGSGAVVTGSLLASLRRDPEIARISLATTVTVTLNGRHVGVLAVTPVRGPALISRVDGRLPAHDRELMLGAATMRSVGAQPGGTVRVMVTDTSGAAHQRCSGWSAGRPSRPASAPAGWAAGPR